jgi:copper chaperone NosL
VNERTIVCAALQPALFSKALRCCREIVLLRIAVLSMAIWILGAELAGASPKEFVKPMEKDKCPVCGMFTAKYSDWVAEVVFRDGTYAVFDGPKDLFKYYFDLKKYAPARRQEDIRALFVTDYYTVTAIDGFKAFYVLGSDIYGPMGKEPVPFAKQADAAEFLKDHHGRKILRFGEITPVVISELE